MINEEYRMLKAQLEDMEVRITQVEDIKDNVTGTTFSADLLLRTLHVARRSIKVKLLRLQTVAIDA